MITTIVAAGIAAFILIYFASTINEKKHFILRLLLFSFGIILMIFLGKGAIDGQEICESVVNSTVEFTNSTNHTTINYTHGVHCYDRHSNSTTGTVLYKTLLYMFIVYVAYILFYFIYWMFGLTTKFWKRRR